MNKVYVEFLGWEGSYARFRVNGILLPNERRIKQIIVAHEGDWVHYDGMLCYREYDAYEDVQKRLGVGLDFIAKEYSTVMKRSLITYMLKDNNEVVLAVPATGEEICFEIYASDGYHGMFLLHEGEL